MRTLAIDTSSEACSVALFDGDVLIDNAHRVIGRGHAEQLLPMIAELQGGGRADRIMVGCGPGSFTGLRVGIAAARGLGIGWGVPVTGFSSMGLVAVAAPNDTARLVVIEGGHGQWFVQYFASDGLAGNDPASLMPEVAIANRTDIVVGNRAGDFVERRGFGTAIAGLPDATLAMGIAAGQCNWLPQPVYGRAADASVKLAQ